MYVQIREENSGDIESIRRLTTEAFQSASHSSHTEAAIIDALRNAGSLSLSLVATQAGQSKAIGHIAFSPVTISGQSGIRWYGLGPVSVRPSYHGQGVGSELVREGLRRLQQLGGQGCVVLGSPDYYRRFGFYHEEGLTYVGAPAMYFMALRLEGNMPTGRVKFHAGFEAE